MDLAPDPDEPLAPWLQHTPAATAAYGVHVLRFEFTSRGDRVPGRLLAPADASGPVPLILLQHGLGDSKQAAYLATTALPWVRGGTAVASIDLPLHGERASGKLTRWLLDSVVSTGRDALADSLCRDFVRQSVLDLRRAVDALASLPLVDEDRVAFAGFSLGAMVGVRFLSVDARPRAAALALAGGGLGPPDLDPATHVAALAPRPLLLVNAERDRRIPREAAMRLFAAASEPKQQLWFDGTHAELPGVALKAMWTFLRAQLGLGGG